MSPSSRVEDIARAAAGLQPDDLPGLVRLRDELSALTASTDGDGSQLLARACLEAAELLERIVLRGVDDPELAMRDVRAVLEDACRVAGAPPRAVPEDMADDAWLEGESAREIDLELLESWVSSCGGALGELESALVEIETGGGDPEREAEARRLVHTIKGEAGVLSLEAIQTVCHECESLIDLCALRGVPFPTGIALELVDWVGACVASLVESAAGALPDHGPLLARLVRALGTTGTVAPWESPAPPSGASADRARVASAAPDGEGDDSSAPIAPAESPPLEPIAAPPRVELPHANADDETTLEFVSEAREHIANAEQSLLELERDAGNAEQINTVFRAFHTIKGVAGFLRLAPIVEITHAAETLLDRARSGELTLTPAHLDVLLASCDVLGQLVGVLQRGEPPLASTVRGLLDWLERAVAGELGTGGPASHGPAGATAHRPAGERGARPRLEQTVKVATGRMDALVDMVGELVIGYEIVRQDEAIRGVGAHRTERSLAHVARIIRDLQEVAMSLRLVTMRGTFQKMSRLVRDVAARSGKSVRLHVEGEGVELDRRVVEEIADPLVHMIRNACDHGIESAEERVAAGKPPQGNLWLRAAQRGESIIVEVADDGRGLSRGRILERARSRGLIDGGRDDAGLTDSEVFGMIFAPGFSTAERVTDLSGRGVGMDVVRRNIEALRGTIDISSREGQGSTFRMRIPLTMAIIDGLVVRVGPQRYVVPTLAIERCFRPRADDVFTVEGRGEVARTGGGLVPFRRAGRMLGVGGGAEHPEDGVIVVVASHDTRLCLLVDEAVGQQQVVIKSLGRGLGPVDGVSGGAILGDGRVALILDVAAMCQQEAGAALCGVGAAGAGDPPREMGCA